MVNATRTEVAVKMGTRLVCGSPVEHRRSRSS